MPRYKTTITIHPLSYWLNSGGRGRGLLDNEVHFHKTGFPKLRASTFKGLLRESCTEVAEMTGSGLGLVTTIFGKEGQLDGGAMSFKRDFYLPDWDNLRTAAEKLIKEHTLTTDAVKNYYTHTVYQTRIQDGVASDGSLRRFGVMLPMVSFEAELFFDISEEQVDTVGELVTKGCQNLMHLGTSRNRGFGRVTVKAGEFTKVIESTPYSIKAKVAKLAIKNIGVLQLANHGANPNEILTEHKVSGTRVRGLLAHRYISKKRQADSYYAVNSDHTFYDLFLSGKVKYGTAYPEGSIPLPQNIHTTKQTQQTINVFEQSDVISSHRPAMVSRAGHEVQKISVDTSMEFNMSRMKDRLSGTSTEDTGAIYYEEVIDEGHTFTGHIYAESEGLLETLTKTVGTDFDLQLGANKSTMGYSSVSLAEQKGEAGFQQVSGTSFQLIFLAPTVLLNKFGYPQVTETLLTEAVKSIDANLAVDTDRIALTTSLIEQYVSLWRASTDRQLAIEAGSTLVLTSTEELTLPNRVFIGMRNNEGLGECLLVPYDGNNFLSTSEPDSTRVVSASYTELDKVIAYQKRISSIANVKKMAVQQAMSTHTNLSNSAISNILETFKNATTKEDVNESIYDATSGKEKLNYLGKSLDAEGYILKAKYFNFRRWQKEPDFEKQRTYWIQYFQTQRLKK